MDIHDAIDRACADVGISPPRDRYEGRWIKTDTLSGKSGKGDGRVMLDDERVTAWNWQTGEKSTVHAGDPSKPIDRAKVARKIANDRKQKVERARQAADVASQMVSRASLSTHPYLAAKGFPSEKVLTLAAADVAAIGGSYLVPEFAREAIVLPARFRDSITSVQLIWDNGTKKFLAGGEISGCSLRIARGAHTWLCEGFATGLTLRMALRAMNRSDAILCAFSAYNVSLVAKAVEGQRWIVTDNDKPMEQFDGLGTGEHYARLSGVPYVMPPTLGQDVNDLYCEEGIYAVQRLLGSVIRRRPKA